MAARPALAGPASRMPERSLDLVHRVTGETLRETYFADGAYLPEALARIDWFMRDWHLDAATRIEPALLDLLHRLTRRFGTKGRVEVMSAYRTAETNARLREEGYRPASGSLHLVGRAIDLRVPGVPLAVVRRAALSLHSGGVGFYPRRNFVHLDTGEVRHWVGA
ncbi:YcbK family protein [Arenibaculum pallidiluteum]|uniref:YcbK family protein n=1 Tax=Arenibaculum pallidiluteum TaxID=2812559 RepID=UPI001A97013A|nr:DUF882 domain-containing protein [Arenibaculum pallidiluteum]